VARSSVIWGALLIVGGCSSPANGPPGRKPVVIFAAASTKEAVEELAAQFKKDAGIEVAVSLGGSSQLAKQIEQGAAVDLFLSADEASVDFLASKQKIDARANLLTNRLAVVGPADSKLELKTLADLADPKFAKIAIAEAKVPAGEYARQALTKAGVLEQVQSRFVGGVDVRATLQFVVRGECEAGFVYATDVRAKPGETSTTRVLLDVAQELHKPIVYPLVRIRGGAAAGDDVAKFHDFLRSQRAAEVFRGLGFGIAAAGVEHGAAGAEAAGAGRGYISAAGAGRGYISARNAAEDSRSYILAGGS
jgi:molybdate transport system substrate-binding protein